MKQVRFTEEQNECCGRILNEAAVKERFHCGMKSVHGTEKSPLYYLCGECYLRSVYSAKLQTK